MWFQVRNLEVSELLWLNTVNTTSAPFTSTLSAWKPNQGQVETPSLMRWHTIDVGHYQQVRCG